MELSLIEKILELKDLIKHSSIYVNLYSKEKNLENSEDAILLSYKKDLAIMDYEDNLKHFGKNSKEIFKSKEYLSSIINDLNNLEVVKEYKSSLDEFNNLMIMVEKVLFRGLDD